MRRIQVVGDLEVVLVFWDVGLVEAVLVLVVFYFGVSLHLLQNPTWLDVSPGPKMKTKN